MSGRTQERGFVWTKSTSLLIQALFAASFALLSPPVISFVPPNSVWVETRQITYENAVQLLKFVEGTEIELLKLKEAVH